jgi:hypothetical protein
MKNFDSRTYSVNDFLEWFNTEALELSPKFQRRSVWTDNARSYLMDTIVRGKPIPKVFIRQKLNVTTHKSVREVVDGQQRLRTILSFLKDGFVISKKHNPVYGGLYFSQLDVVDDEIQGNILNYEISADLLVNMPDSEILDIFSRLNSYSVTLNEQEKINANHFGPFKTLADGLAHNLNAFWTRNKILADKEILRMGDVTLCADLLIAMTTGIKSKKQIKPYFDLFEKEFEFDPEGLAEQFRNVITTIDMIFNQDLKSTEFRRIHLFYTLFTAIYHLLYGLPGNDRARMDIERKHYAKIENNLRRINLIFEDDNKQLDPDEVIFLEDSRRATTDKPVRERRTNYVIDLILQ